MPACPDEDRALLRRAQQGEDAAVDALARAWRPYILTICRDLCASPDEVEERGTGLEPVTFSLEG